MHLGHDITIAGLIVCCYVLFSGTSELEDQQVAAAHKQEIIAAAKVEFKKRQLEEKYGTLYRQAEQLTFPVSSYRH